MMDLNCFPRLGRCCCFSLRTGCLVIGYFSLVFSLAALVVVSLSLVNIVHFMAAHRNDRDAPISPEEMSRVAVALYVLHGYCLALMLLYLAINLILVISVHRDVKRWKQWFVYGALLVLVLGLAHIVVSSVFQGAKVAVGLLVWCLWVFFSICVVKSVCEDIPEPDLKNREMIVLNNPEHTGPGARSSQELLRDE